MLVKVNDKFRGNYGQYDKVLATVHVKRAGDDPFEVDDEVAKAQIAAGVLVAVAKKIELPKPPVEEVKTEKPVKKNKPAFKGKKKDDEEPPVIGAADPE